jgi:hypothetical protein
MRVIAITHVTLPVPKYPRELNSRTMTGSPNGEREREREREKERKEETRKVNVDCAWSNAVEFV